MVVDDFCCQARKAENMNPSTHYAVTYATARGRQSFHGRARTFEGGKELFDPHPFAWKTVTPPGGLWTKKLAFLLFGLA